ncbi:hypothetical protein PYCCODRAFT_1431457 [Trametes coccinea BRFM310]|uniref:Uncharacterized protein n=1 Tax=Trametes coccinea (strain BRFM310) TaxID=1353009 RepID=A0A1Y2J1Z3_TRAC3|nr:hypothetical protein PYCCODRAFT_1431457 [Trametes coccinea BRFM310]
MSTVLRALSKHARSVSNASRSVPTASTSRAFHSPFAVLAGSSSPLTTPPAPSSLAGASYEKQLEYSSDPFAGASGHRTYVVSQPDPANTPYEVPYGAYPTSAPYQNYARTDAPVPEGAQHASTAPGLAHPITQKVPRNEAGVGESAAIRHREAPGEMHARGGSYSGQGMADPAGTQKGNGGELPDVNPPPLFEHAEKFSKAGVDNAWKERK